MLVFWNKKHDLSLFDSLYKILSNGSSGGDNREQGIVCVTGFRYATELKEAKFWLRADVMEQMQEEDWKVCI